MIELSGLDVNYGARKVLDAITFSVDKGRFVGIIGPNGSGKTTLLKAMSRVLEPSAGIIRLDNIPLDRIKSRDLARLLAVVPQETGTGFDFTVRDVVMMGRYPYTGRFSKDTEEDVSICKNAMDLTGISHLANRPVSEISGGELQRTIIARALAQQPRHLLLDEATSHLDISHQIDILTTIRGLSDRIAVVGVFHDLNLAANFCDEIIVIKNGKIDCAGTPERVITPETLSRVFDLDAAVSIHPVTGKPLVVPLLPAEEYPATKTRVHVICGGGTGADIMLCLHRAGCRVTTGVLAMNDSDYAAAARLGIECIAEPPFSPVTDVSREALKEKIRGADCVVLTATPFGSGNLNNLSVLAEPGMPPVLFVTGDGRAAVPDHTGGAATRILQDLEKERRLIIVAPDQVAARCGQYGKEIP
ncbi:MAG: ABC transporter ATP-binding protein [Methanoregula sp.]|jgi:iron complex transport system ATP-binding protein